MAEKLFYSMGEVAEMFDVNASLIRHWESQFSVIRPKRNKKGNRLFSPRDVENLKLIYHLVKERGMTLEGAKKALRQQPAEGGMERDAELMERLQRIRALLVEVREDLKAGEGEILADADADADTDAGAVPDAPDAMRAICGSHSSRCCCALACARRSLRPSRISCVVRSRKSRCPISLLVYR